MVALRCRLHPSTVIIYRRALAALVLVDLYDRWSVADLLYGTQSVGLRGLDLPILDDHAWKPVLLLAAFAAARSAVGAGRRTWSVVLLACHVGLSLRAPAFVWILDRYAQTLILVSSLLPHGRCALETEHGGVAALARLQVLWIYVDAAWVKLQSGAWWRASGRISAIDVYVRHTTGARLVRSFIGSDRAYSLLSSLAVLVELLCPATLLLAGCLGRGSGRGVIVPRLARGALGILACLHLAIAALMSGTVLLSAFATLALLLWLDVPAADDEKHPSDRVDAAPGGGGGDAAAPAAAPVAAPAAAPAAATIGAGPSLLLALYLLACLLYEGRAALGGGSTASEPAASALRVLLSNRWNVFGPAEAYVTWEMAPGRLVDGRVVDVWRLPAARVSWDVPGPGEVLHHGRYRMFPYLSDAARDRGPRGERFWDAVCDEWTRRMDTAAGDASASPLAKFNFFLLRAPLERGGTEERYGNVTKTLVRSHVCPVAREGLVGGTVDANHVEAEPRQSQTHGGFSVLPRQSERDL